MNNASKLVEVLTKEELTIGSIESFTGGLFSKYITDINGASKVFKGSIIAYANEIKEKLVDIDKDLIEKYGVVSWPVAEKLAINGLKILNVDICVSFTGNAGPTTCDNEAALGECYMAIAFKGNVWSIPLKLNDCNREQIRTICVESIIDATLSIIS